jgi:hypothetical protein
MVLAIAEGAPGRKDRTERQSIQNRKISINPSRRYHSFPFPSDYDDHKEV